MQAVFIVGLTATPRATIISASRGSNSVPEIAILLVVAIGAADAAGVNGPLGVFDAMKQAHPSGATLPGLHGSTATNTWWWMSFLLLTPLGSFALPHMFQVSYSAKDVATIRRDQVVQPLYSLFYVLIVMIALAAVLALPKLTDKQANASLLIFVREKYPDWVVGLLGGAGILVALVPTAVLVLAASSLFTRNVLGARSEKWASSLTAIRVGVLVFTALSVLFVARSNEKLLSIVRRADRRRTRARLARRTHDAARNCRRAARARRQPDRDGGGQPDDPAAVGNRGRRRGRRPLTGIRRGW